jgi:hypothetical protein
VDISNKTHPEIRPYKKSSGKARCFSLPFVFDVPVVHLRVRLVAVLVYVADALHASGTQIAAPVTHAQVYVQALAYPRVPARFSWFR